MLGKNVTPKRSAQSTPETVDLEWVLADRHGSKVIGVIVGWEQTVRGRRLFLLCGELNRVIRIHEDDVIEAWMEAVVVDAKAKVA